MELYQSCKSYLCSYFLKPFWENFSLTFIIIIILTNLDVTMELDLNSWFPIQFNDRRFERDMHVNKGLLLLICAGN